MCVLQLSCVTSCNACRQKRLRAAEEKRTKLKSPNFMISPTRLSVRNIPFSLTEAQLKALCVKALKERASKEKPEIVQVRHARRDVLVLIVQEGMRDVACACICPLHPA